MNRGHSWHHAPPHGYECRDCGVRYDGTHGACLASAALQRRVAQLHADARQLADDLYAARQAAEPGSDEKHAARYPLRHIEHALPHLERAAAGGAS